MKPKFLLAPDKFKNSLTGADFCRIADSALKRIFPLAECIHLPLSDGGDGSSDIVQYHWKARCIHCSVTGVFGKPISASYLYVAEKKTAFIETAEACGMKTIPLGTPFICSQTTTQGVGEMVLDAAHRGAKKIILGVGGTATHDLGIGMASALGYRFSDLSGLEVLPIGKHLSEIQKIETSLVPAILQDIEFTVLCDVLIPLCGRSGTAHKYAAQKGASQKEIAQLEKGTQHLAHIMESTLENPIYEIAGAGAGGGLAGGLLSFLNAKLLSGKQWFKKITNLDTYMAATDWVITGEGKLDAQTFDGKILEGIIESAKMYSTPIAAFCGSVKLSVEEQERRGITYLTSVLQKVSDWDTVIRETPQSLFQSIYNFARVVDLRSSNKV